MQILFHAESAVQFIFLNTVFGFYNVWNKYYLSDKIKKKEMGGTQHTYGADERYIQDLGVEI
jgi:hypothetical protein